MTEDRVEEFCTEMVMAFRVWRDTRAGSLEEYEQEARMGELVDKYFSKEEIELLRAAHSITERRTRRPWLYMADALLRAFGKVP